MNIYVGNLSYETTEDDLRAAFSRFGTVDSARLISDRDTGRPKGFGFVEMSNNNEAQAAINALNSTVLKDREIKVNEARPREERPARSNYGGGGGGGRRW
jgi:RNA recognition motif-containing protein